MQKADSLLSPDKDHIFGSGVDRASILVQAMGGDHEGAVDRLAISLTSPNGYNPWMIALDPRWDFMRDNPRFKDMASPEGHEPSLQVRERIGDGT